MGRRRYLVKQSGVDCRERRTYFGTCNISDVVTWVTGGDFRFEGGCSIWDCGSFAGIGQLDEGDWGDKGAMRLCKDKAEVIVMSPSVRTLY